MKKEAYLYTPQGKLWYSVYGQEKSGFPLLVVHGGPGFLSMTDTVEMLADSHPVYFYDQLGCGRSDRAKSTETYSLEHYIDELDFVRQSLAPGKVVLMGFSWGCGLITAYLLAKKPKNIAGVILSAPLLSSPRWERDQREHISLLPQKEKAAILSGERNGNYGEDYQNAMMRFYERYLCKMNPWPDSLSKAMGQLNMDIYLSMWGQSEFTISGTLKNFDLSDRLAEIIQPVLLTCGDTDEAAVKTLKDFQLSFKNASLAVIPDAAHLHQIEQPEIYLAVIRAFLKKI